MNIEVLDAFEGIFEHEGKPLFSLVRRSGTLDGTVPLRAAQACVPLLEGNAYGVQLRLALPLAIERRLGRAPRLVSSRVPVETLHRAVMPRLVAHGLITSAFEKAFARGFLHEERGVLRLFTGLFVRAPAGTWIRVASNANRRSVAYTIDEVFAPDDAGFVPLVLGIRARGNVSLEGELATLSLVRPDVTVERLDLSDAPELGEAHVRFYDATYFAAKKGESTRKYRKLVTRAEDEQDDGPSRVVLAGPGDVSIEIRRAVLSAERPTPKKHAHGVTTMRFSALLPFTATFDGHALTLDYDRSRLARDAKALERTWSSVYGPAFQAKHQGALWYLTKYFTPHPPGEPHFFVKPWAFVQTPPGWSSLVDGACGDGWEVMRGVVSTDLFHATPAVFRVWRVGETVRVREGDPLIDVIPIPRSLLQTRVRRVKMADAA